MDIEWLGKTRALSEVLSEMRNDLDTAADILARVGQRADASEKVSAALQDLVHGIGELATSLQPRILQREVEAAAQSAVIDALISTHPDKHELRAAIAVRRAAFSSGTALHHAMHGAGDDQLQPMIDAAFERHLRDLPKPT